MTRHDYAFPFHIDAASQQGAQASYEAHIEQMIRQVLLTSPGERADLPDFGSGLRQLLFAGISTTLAATTQMQVQQALNRWLSNQIQVQNVTVVPPEEAPDAARLLIQIDYVLIETQSSKSTEVLVI